jgi:hypothetical protein
METIYKKRESNYLIRVPSLKPKTCIRKFQGPEWPNELGSWIT